MELNTIGMEVTEMEINEIISLISSVGFPIIACIFMWRFISTTLKEFTNTMVQNTTVLTKLAEKIDKDSGGTTNDH